MIVVGIIVLKKIETNIQKLSSISGRGERMHNCLYVVGRFCDTPLLQPLRDGPAKWLS